MGYLHSTGGITNSKKMVVSIFFRAPSTSITSTNTAYQTWLDEGGPRPRLVGILPLLVFGAPAVNKDATSADTELDGDTTTTTAYIWDSASCGWILKPTSDIFPENPFDTDPGTAIQYSFSGGTTDIDPSYIGLDCTTIPPTLSVNIVMTTDDPVTLEGLFPQEVSVGGSTAVNWHFGGAASVSPFCAGVPVDGSGQALPFESVSGVSNYEGAAPFLIGGRPENFRNRPRSLNRDEPSVSESDLGDTGGQTIAADLWHHLLLSIDLTNGCATVGNIQTSDGDDPTLGAQGAHTLVSSTMYMAIDDVNLTEKALSAYWPTGSADPNAILSVNGYLTASYNIFNIPAAPFNDERGNTVTLTQNYESPNYVYAPSAGIPATLVGIPANAGNSGAVQKVEMARLQIYTGVTLDTGIESNRRAFITASGTPAASSLARDLLDTVPDVEFTSSALWRAGSNSGSAGNFVKTGTVNDYSPGP